jgi:hypothetical protein
MPPRRVGRSGSRAPKQTPNTTAGKGKSSEAGAVIEDVIVSMNSDLPVDVLIGNEASKNAPSTDQHGLKSEAPPIVPVADVPAIDAREGSKPVFYSEMCIQKIELEHQAWLPIMLLHAEIG